MGAARNVEANTILTAASYELRNTDGAQYTAATELFEYLNACNELVYQILAEENSELIATGTGTLPTVAGTETYALSSNSMGDFWAPFRLNGLNTDQGYRYAIYLTDSTGTIYDPLKMTHYGARFAEIQGGANNRSTPEYFYLLGDNLGLLPVPDAIYTVTVARYFPNFVPLPATTGATGYMPYKNLFNQEIKHGICMLAKNREDQAMLLEGPLRQLFFDRAMSIMNLRRENNVAMTIRRSR